MSQNKLSSTPLPVIANITRVVTRVVDRVTGDRVDYPLLVASACVEALKLFGLGSRIMYGKVAWIEILANQQAAWAGCWGKHFHFWVETEFAEVVDLNVSVAYRKRAHDTPTLKALYSAPMLWSAEIPSFYRFVPEGIAELELTEERDIRNYERVLQEISEKCGPKHLTQEGSVASGQTLQQTDSTDAAGLDFPNEPILCPGRRLLDDSQQTFKHFDRALSIYGMPKAPF